LEIFSRNSFVMTFLQRLTLRKQWEIKDLSPGNRGHP
jgi:hypothetical protein